MMRSMVDPQSAPGKNWSAAEKKPPNPTTGKKTGQSKVSNKINCNIRLISRALGKRCCIYKDL